MVKIPKLKNAAKLYKSEDGEVVLAQQFRFDPDNGIVGYYVILEFLQSQLLISKEDVQQIFVPKILYTMEDNDWLVEYRENYPDGADPRQYFQVVPDRMFKSKYKPIDEEAPF